NFLMPKKNILLYTIILLPLMAILFFHANLGSYSRFIADDYCSAYFGQRLGLFRYIWYWFINWGGRFSAIASDMFLVWLGPQKIGFVSGIAIYSWASGFSALIFSFFSGKQKIINRLLVSISLGFLTVFDIIVLSPNVPQSFYWFSAFRTHTLPAIVFTLYFLFFIFIRTWKVHPAYIWVIGLLSFFMAMFTAGFSEPFTLIELLFLIGIAGVEYVKGSAENKKKNIIFLLSGAAGVLLTLFIMLSSPGNSNRQAAFHHVSGIIELLSISVIGYSRFLFQFFQSPEKFSAILGSLLIFFVSGTFLPEKFHLSGREIICLFILGFVVPFISYPPAAYGMGDYLPDRAQAIPIYFMLIFLFTASISLGRKITLPKLGLFFFQSIGTAFLLFSVFISFQNLIGTRHIFVDYANKMDSFENQIISARENGKKTFIVPQLGNWAGSYDPTDNPKFFSTACFSLYYRIQILGPSIDKP
ncbi:MAG: hypothetical protein WCP19_12605, partial [Chloroflexota bacterium]